MKWFKLHTDSSTLSPYMSLVEDQFGLEGYARMIKLKEAIASQMVTKDSHACVEYPERKWCQILKCKAKGLSGFLSFLDQKGIISFQRTENGIEVTFDKLRDSLDNRAASSNLREPSGAPKQIRVREEKKRQPTESHRDGGGTFFQRFNKVLRSDNLKIDLRKLVVQSVYDGELSLDQFEDVIEKVHGYFEKKDSEKAQRFGKVIVSELIKLKYLLGIEMTKPSSLRGSQETINAVLESYSLPLEEDTVFLVTKRRLKKPDLTADDLAYLRLRYKSSDRDIPSWMGKYEKQVQDATTKRRLLSH